MRIRFDVVSIKGVRRWKENGKPRQQTKQFEQTINPWNRNAQGLPKNRAEIMEELIAERKEWLRVEEAENGE